MLPMLVKTEITGRGQRPLPSTEVSGGFRRGQWFWLVIISPIVYQRMTPVSKMHIKSYEEDEFTPA